MDRDKFAKRVLIAAVVCYLVAAVVGMCHLFWNNACTQRAPAVYNIKRIYLDKEESKYRITDGDGDLIAIVNLF